MQASNGPLPISSWTCPHCHATWHSGRQYCVDCGYGVTASAGASTEVRVEELRREAGAHEAQRQAGVTWMQAGAGPGLRPDMVETNESALRRSLEAESALQAEVALLRERSVQLQTRLDEQRRVFVTGVQQMMQPLQDYFTAQHLEVPFEALVPQAIEQLGVLTQTVAKMQAEPRLARELRTQVRQESSITHRDLEEVAQRTDELRGIVHACTRRLDALEHRQSERAVQRENIPETYDTFVMSDRQSAEIERALLDAQTRGRSFPG